MASNLHEKQMVNRLGWFLLLALAFVISALVFAALFSVASLLIGLAVTAACIAYVTAPDFRLFLRNHLSFFSHPKHSLVLGGIGAYGVLLFCASVARLVPTSPSPSGPGSSRIAKSNSASMIRNAEIALDLGDLDRAEQLTKQLEADSSAAHLDEVVALRAKLRIATEDKNTRRANDQVLRLMIDANQDFAAKRFPKVDAALRQVFVVQGATELKDAYSLANRLHQFRLAAADERITAGDLDVAGSLIQEAEAVPGVQEKGASAEMQLKLANARVLKKIESAQKLSDEKRWTEAEAELNAALAIKNASELADARQLLTKVQTDRLAESDSSVAKARGLASPLVFVKSRMDDEGNILEIYAGAGQLDIETLKNLCLQKQKRTRAMGAYFLVVFDESANAQFPSTPFRDRFGADELVRTHIRAVYEFNRSNGYSELEFYETNAVAGRLRREHI